jgi:hypothetical protein
MSIGRRPSPPCECSPHGSDSNTKKVATIGGVTFTFVFFIAFTLSERYQKRSKTPRSSGGRVERFRLEVPQRSIAVPVANRRLSHLHVWFST